MLLPFQINICVPHLLTKKPLSGEGITTYLIWISVRKSNFFHCLPVPLLANITCRNFLIACANPTLRKGNNNSLKRVRRSIFFMACVYLLKSISPTHVFQANNNPFNLEELKKYFFTVCS